MTTIVQNAFLVWYHEDLRDSVMDVDGSWKKFGKGSLLGFIF